MQFLRRLRISMEDLFIATYGLVGFRYLADPIGDNSMLLHMRTGKEIVARGIPRADPFSWTAPGTDWVVQSWLATWTYGWLDRIAGPSAVVIEQAVLGGLFTILLAVLARTGSAVRTFVTAGIVTAIVLAGLSPRPLLFGLVAFGLLVLIVERGASPWWIVPTMWIWTQSHGSFPLGIAWLGLVCVGSVVDDRALPRRELRYLVVTVGSVVLGAVSPLGPKLLAFPLVAGDRQEIFSRIVEWQSPKFTGALWTACLLGILAALALILRARPPWRDVLPVVVFIGMGLVAMRNLLPAAVVIAPVLGRGWRAPASEGGGAAKTPPIHFAFVGILLLVVVLTLAGAATTPGKNLNQYPVAATDAMIKAGLRDERVVHEGFVGGYWINRFGRDANVFMDDRFDMYPVSFVEDYLELRAVGPDARRVLDRYDADVVLWRAEQPVSTLLTADPDWKLAYTDKRWRVFVRR